jgi:hypothetical protein
VRRADKNNESVTKKLLKPLIRTFLICQPLYGAVIGYRILRQINPNYYPTLEQNGSECWQFPVSFDSDMNEVLFMMPQMYGLVGIALCGMTIWFVSLVSYKLISDSVLKDRILTDCSYFVEKIKNLLDQLDQTVLSDNFNLKRSLNFFILNFAIHALYYFVGKAYLNSYIPNRLNTNTDDAILNLSVVTLASTVGFEVASRGVLYFSKSAYNMSRRVCKKQQQVLPEDDTTIQQPRSFSM